MRGIRRWRLAQAAELRWWRCHLRKRHPQEYLAWKADQWRQELELIGPGLELRDGARVLDAGCGPAGIFIVLPDCTVHAVDPLIDAYESVLPHFDRTFYPWVTFFPTPVEYFEPPAEYDLVFSNNAVNHFSDLELSRIRRQTIGFVFQSFNLLSGLSAWENVSYPLIPTGMKTKDRFERSVFMLERVGLGDRIHHSPEELSGGQQQRVAIARALINEPQILIADEPTSNIDDDSVTRLLDILGELKADGKTIIISSHDPIFKSHGDVLFSLDRGRLKGVRRLSDKGGESG